ncbi:hypothetical protein F2Q70_00042706 [Brassica cretica]|uniref:Uncharacterized protein n=1 Tax=Brassica cretica TaxID=69181 RepID=A0A8S9KFC6_BRACR|nr:hypothetical protein F2Q70_00042706 [Brassica cretica]
MDTANPPRILNPLEDRSVIMGEDKKESTVEKQERSSILTEEKSWEGKQEIVPTVKSPQIVENDKLEEDAASVQKESRVSNWSLVSPTKVGKSQSPQGHAPKV